MTAVAFTLVDAGWCPTCRERTVVAPGRPCPWCETSTWRGPRGHWPGQPSRIGPEEARLLASAHAGGMSLRAIARATWQQFGYASQHSCLEGIRYALRREGLAARDQREATAASNRARGTKRLPGEDKNAYRRRIRREAREAAA